jgi:hypothetical protein
MKKSEQAKHKTYYTPVSDIEEKHGVTISNKPGEKIGEFLERKGYGSLADMMRKD